MWANIIRMMEVSKLVEALTGLYKPGYRYLQGAEVNTSGAKGLFKLKSTEYMETMNHMTDVEAQLCLNQIAYVFFAYHAINRTWPELGLNTLEDFLSLTKEGMFVLESRKRFRRETVPAKEFAGTLELRSYTKISTQAFVARLNFDLNEGACRGYLKLAIRLDRRDI